MFNFPFLPLQIQLKLAAYFYISIGAIESQERRTKTRVLENEKLNARSL